MNDKVKALKKDLAEKDRVLQAKQEEADILRQMIQAMGLPDPFKSSDKTPV